MKYSAEMEVTGWYCVNVEAASPEEASAKALGMFCEADFGELENMDANIVRVEDENGQEVRTV